MQRHLRSVVAIAFSLIIVGSSGAEAAVQAASATLIAETVANGQVDPGEGIVMSLCIRNPDATPTGHLIASIETVESPSGAQRYGSLAPNEVACRSYSFVVPAACGMTTGVVMSVGATASTLVKLLFPIQVGAPGLVETFDMVSAPALPAGWTAELAAGPATVEAWKTQATPGNSAPNRAFAPSSSVTTDNRLTSPAFIVPAGPSQLSFFSVFNLEEGFDGAVLEIAVGTGAFMDILAAGGSFGSGGYNGTIPAGFGSPIAGRQAWTGLSGFVVTVVRMPPAAAERSVRLRWRVATDSSVTAPDGGWIVDTISVQGTSCATVPTSIPWGLESVTSGHQVTFFWRRPTGISPSGYVLEASTDSGLTFPFSIPTGNLTSFTAVAPDITVVARVRALLTGGTPSAPSNSVVVAIGSAAPPGRITNLLSSVNGTQLTLAWNLPSSGGTLSNVVLEAGSGPGLANLATLPLPPTATGFTAPGLPPGTYFVRMRTVGPLLVGNQPSNEVTITVPDVCSPPVMPVQYLTIRSGNLVTFNWQLPPIGTPAQSEFVIEAGNSPGASNLGVVPITQTSLTAPLPPGNYFVRVFARNSCGSSPRTAEASFTIP